MCSGVHTPHVAVVVCPYRRDGVVEELFALESAGGTQRRELMHLGYTDYAQNEKEVNSRKRTEICGPHHIDVWFLIFGSLLADSYGANRAGKHRIVLRQDNSNQGYVFCCHMSP
jgi:hypothetical protein